MEHLISFLEVEIKRINDILDSYEDAMTLSLESYHYEKGRVEALEYVLERLDEILEEEKIMKIDPKQLFEANKDIRKFMSVGMSDENMTYFEEEYGITDIELLLNHASIYVDLGELPEVIEVKEEE